MVNLILCELLKLKRSPMLLISFLGALVTPLMMAADAVKISLSHSDTRITLSGLYSSCSLYTIMLFGLIVYTVVGSYLFSREHTESTLKNILTVPVSKVSFITAKFIMLLLWIMALTVVSWLAMLLLAGILGLFYPVEAFYLSVALYYLREMLLGGILLFFTITPLVFLSIRTKNLVVPIITSAAVAMGNVALSNEALGGLYPWTASYLLVSGRMAETGYSPALAIALVTGVSLLGLGASIAYFLKEDIQ